MADLRYTFVAVWKDGSGTASSGVSWTGLNDADVTAMKATAAPVAKAYTDSKNDAGNIFMVMLSSDDPALVVPTDKAGLEYIEQALIDANIAALAYGKAQPAP
jgi:hypothetical protein